MADMLQHGCNLSAMLASFWYTDPMNFSTLFIDLDDTIYPKDSGVWQAIRQRIDLFVVEKFHLNTEQAMKLRQDLFLRYGTTMRGLQAEYHIDEDEYLAFVHHVPLVQFLKPAPELCAMLRRYPQQKVILTNADTAHARRVLSVLGLADCFESIIDIKAMAPYCKPMPEAFKIALDRAGEPDASRCVLVDDAGHNLQAAHQLGFFTVQVGGNGLHEVHRSHEFPDAAIQRLADLPDVLPVDGC
jgi:putative hydrolase of the HAD superfamily